MNTPIADAKASKIIAKTLVARYDALEFGKSRGDKTENLMEAWRKINDDRTEAFFCNKLTSEDYAIVWKKMGDTLLVIG